jgi:ATP-dependent HslUV protease subunit HslV
MLHSTTILAVRHRDRSVMAGDGQVTFGQTIVKQSARNIRPLYGDKLLAGFAGSADVRALRAVRVKLGNIAAISSGRRSNARTGVRIPASPAQAMLIVRDKTSMFLLSEPAISSNPTTAWSIGSGGPYALAAARRSARIPISTHASSPEVWPLRATFASTPIIS